MTQPLAGLKVLDFSTLLPGPYATQLLADMGAEVLRIESPTRPDSLKVLPPMVGEISAAHGTINRNKQSLAIDLKHQDAKGIVMKLLQEYDIIVEQFRPGVMERLGLDYNTLAEQFPALIYCSITGYGQTGPWKLRAGHDINYLSLSGLASFSGRPDTGPVLSGTQIADIAGGSHHAVMAILAAVIERSTSNKGQYLDISMSDAALALSTMFSANALASGENPGYGTELLNGGFFYDYYQTADGRYLSVGSLEPQFAMGMLAALDLTDCLPLFERIDLESQQQLRQHIAEKIAQRTLAEWQEVFGRLDVCIEPVLTLTEAAEQPHFVERNMLGEAVDHQGNTLKQINTALPFKRSEVHTAGAVTGAHTREVLSRAGYTDEGINVLIQSKCVTQP